MKELAALIVLVTVLGIGGFMYRNALEHPVAQTNRAYTACTADAKICPDGSAVGRVGANCTFAVCPLPNLEFPTANISFVVPSTFTTSDAPGTEATIVLLQATPLAGGAQHTIRIERFSIPEGQTANDVVLNISSESSMQAFTPILVNGITVQTLTSQTSDTETRTNYYILRERDVIHLRTQDILTPEAAETRAQQAALEILQTLRI